MDKCPTGIRGLDEITFGGLPRGRSTLVCGGPGCGKTLLGIEFLVRGATKFNEPGVCISFEETAEELSANASSLGFDLDGLTSRKLLAIDHVFTERSLTEEAGEYDLEALFVRIGHAVDAAGAKRILLDSMEALFAGFENEAVLRAELRRLFRWLKEKHLTAIVTVERGKTGLTRYGLEEYISDCVILLENDVNETVATRRLRMIKYRGSAHGANQYPFLIEEGGLSVLPVTSLSLKQAASNERISTGIAELDAMLGGKGYFRGSSVLISGTAGTGKTSAAVHFVDAACARGEKCIYFSFEESATQVIRNMRSIGIDLRRWIDRGLLRFDAARPTTFGIEMHLVRMHRLIAGFSPGAVVIDPITALLHAGTAFEARGMLLRLVDFMKGENITAIMTNLTGGPVGIEESGVDISSLVDTWLVLRDIESGAERNRGLNILKARGIAHSNQIREFLLTSHGMELKDVYPGEAGLLTGSARVAREALEAGESLRIRQQIETKQLTLDRKHKALEARIALLRLQLQAEEDEARQIVEQEKARVAKSDLDRADIRRSRSTLESAPDGVRGRKGGGRK